MRLQSFAISAAALSVALFFSLLTYKLWKAPDILLHANGVLTRFEGVESKAYATLNNMDAGTKVWADSAKGQATAIEKTASEAQGAFAATGKAVSSIQGAADAGKGLLASATTTTDALPPLVSTLRVNLEHLTPLEDASTQAVSHFDALLQSKSLSDALDGLGGTAENAKKISGDLYVWSHPLLNPEPCRTKSCTFNRRVMKPIEALTGFGSQAYQFSNFFTPLRVQVQR